MVSALTKEQYQVYKEIKQYLQHTREFENEMAKWERNQKDNINLPHWLQHPQSPVPIAPAPPHLFVSGPGGVGKSFLINTLRLLVQVWASEDPTRPRANGGVLVCAPTGVASFNISASTIHNSLRIPVEKTGRSTFKNLYGLDLEAMRRKTTGLVALIVDEVSMVADVLLHHIHSRTNQIAGTSTSPDSFFGNFAVILVGDLFQLPPVAAKPIFHPQPFGGVSLFRTLFTPVFLTTTVRHSGDTSWANALNQEIRWGQRFISKATIRMLESRVKFNVSAGEISRFKHAIRLFPSNALCNSFNFKMLQQLAFKLQVRPLQIFAKDTLINNARTGNEPERPEVSRTQLFGWAGKNPNNTGSLLQELSLLPGAEVMLRYNISVRDGLTNGARGIVHTFKFPGLPLGQLPDQSQMSQSLYENQIIQPIEVPMPEIVYVKFHDPTIGGESAVSMLDPLTGLFIKVVKIEPMTVTFPALNRPPHQIRRTQIPLIPAYAITIHKSQSLTLDLAVIDISNLRLMKPGMAYVALSRVRSLMDLLLMDGFNYSCIRSSLEVEAEYRRMGHLSPSK